MKLIIFCFALVLPGMTQAHEEVCDLALSGRIVHSTPLVEAQISRLSRHYQSISTKRTSLRLADESETLQFLHTLSLLKAESESLGAVLHRIEALSYPDLIRTSQDWAFSAYLNAILDGSLDFVIKNYQLRRKWSDEFLSKVRQQAMRDRKRSTTFIYKFYSTDEQNNIHVAQTGGTLRIVRATKSLAESLPVDEGFAIAVPFNGESKFELANFSIAKSQNVSAFRELLIQLMLHALRTQTEVGHNPDRPSYYAYADPGAYRMYLGLGFTPIASGQEKKVVDGVVFRPLGISSKGILNIPEAMKRARLYWDQEGLSEVIEHFELLKMMDGDQHHFHMVYPQEILFGA
ncbi:MAG: hypothetical protein AB7K41_05010 [Bdellovibrionales bacterium]